MTATYLLDTCTFLWLALDQKQVPKSVIGKLSSAEAYLYLSIASVWEIGLKDGKGIRLTRPLDDFIGTALESYRIQLMPIQVTACAQLKKLPLIHRDPFDRMLIAQSIVSGCELVTPDKKIARYAVRASWE